MSEKFNIALLALAISLAGCGKKDTADTEKASTTEAQSASDLRSIVKDAFGNDIYKDKHGSVLVSRAALLPLDRYILIDISEDFRANGDAGIAKVSAVFRTAYWAGAKLNYDMLAQDFLPVAWNEKDAFKLGDLAKQNKADLDAAYAQARKNLHFALYSGTSSGVSVSAYNSALKGFPVNFGVQETEKVIWEEPRKGAESSRYWALNQLGNRPVLEQVYVPANEAEARRIETAISGKRDQWGATALAAYYLTHAVGASSNPTGHRTAVLIADGVIVVDPTSKMPLFTIDMRAVEPRATVNNDDLRKYLLGDKVGE